MVGIFSMLDSCYALRHRTIVLPVCKAVDIWHQPIREQNQVTNLQQTKTTRCIIWCRWGQMRPSALKL